MNSKVNEVLSTYQKTLERKEKLITPFREKQSNFEELTSSEEMKYTQLSTEIRMIKLFIEELEYLKEPAKK